MIPLSLHILVRVYDARNIPLRKSVLYMIQGCIQEYAHFIPRSRFDFNGLVDLTRLLELTIGEYDRVFSQECYHAHIRRPYNVSDALCYAELA